MNNEIINHSNLVNTNGLKPAAFDYKIGKFDKQTELILTMLTNAVKEEKNITKKDVVKCYLDFKFLGKDYIPIMGIPEKSKLTRAEIEEYQYYLWHIEKKALQWFQLHLGSAILNGKLLAIPIIEV